MGLNPDHWGPYLWAAIHLVCLGAPEQFDAVSQLGYREFFTNLAYVLPCPACRSHLQEHLQTLPIDSALAGGRDTLFEWSVKLHNMVNKSNGKEEMPLEKARELWYGVANGETHPLHRIIEVVPSEYQHTKKSTLPKTVLISFIMILIGIVIGILYMYLITKMKK